MFRDYRMKTWPAWSSGRHNRGVLIPPVGLSFRQEDSSGNWTFSSRKRNCMLTLWPRSSQVSRPTVFTCGLNSFPSSPLYCEESLGMNVVCASAFKLFTFYPRWNRPLGSDPATTGGWSAATRDPARGGGQPGTAWGLWQWDGESPGPCQRAVCLHKTWREGTSFQHCMFSKDILDDKGIRWQVREEWNISITRKLEI